MSNDDRPKRSWKEIDQMRDGKRSSSERRPRGKAAEERSAKATASYLKEADKLFSTSQGGAEGEQLAKAIRDSHGSPEFGDACRAYKEQVGVPTDPALLALFLDSDDSAIVVAALEGLLALAQGDGLEVSAGLRSQLRVLESSFDDAIAEATEDLLEAL